jgi:Tol biopolymer transport system component
MKRTHLSELFWLPIIILLISAACRAQSTPAAPQPTQGLDVVSSPAVSPTLAASPTAALPASETPAPSLTSPAAADTPAAPQPTLPALAGELRVAYVKNGAIWLWSEGGSPRQLTSGDQNISQVNLSPSGEWIAYTHQIGDLHSELWAAPADGSGEYALLDVSALGALDPSALGTAVVQFEWVPGTHQLAFNTRQVFEGPGTALYNDLRLIDVTTGELSLLFPPGQGGMFYYSPDGSRLALVTPERIELVSADGSDRAEALSFPKVITYSEYELYPVPSWSPDGQSLRVAIPPADPMAEPPQPTTLWLIEAGASPTAIQTGQVATLPFNFFTTLFSPDHAHVAYVSVLGDPADNLWDLRLANANGSGARSIATRPLVSFLAWSPASDWFAFVTGQEQDTHVGSLSGEIRTLPRSPGEWIQGLQWISSDQVLYAVGSHLPGEWRLMLATLGQAEILTIDTGLESPYTLDWSR